MSRTVKLTIPSMGEVRLHLIEDEGGTWEEEWATLKGTAYGDCFSHASKEDLNHGLRGYTVPLMNSLGISPEGALRKIPQASRQCFRRNICPIYDVKNCFPEATKMPWCYEPDGVDNERVRQTVTKAIEYWRDRTYLVVIR